MKNIFKYLGFTLSLALVLLWSCEEEYEAPTAEPNHAYVTTSFGGVTNRMQVNSKMAVIDLSRGVAARTWTFDAGTTDLDYNALETSANATVNIRMTTLGTHTVRLSQTFAGDVYVGTVPSGSTSYDTTFTVTVVDSVRASFTAQRIADMSPLAQANGALNEAVAGREIQFTSTSTGEPTTFAWTAIRKSDGLTKQAEGNPAVIKFSSLGDYNLRLIASSPFGGDTIEYQNYIQVVPSTDPVNLEDIIRVGSNQIGLVFSRDMENPFSCPLEAFTLSVTNGGNAVSTEITSLSLDEQQANVVILNLSGDIYNSDVVTLSYDENEGNMITTDFMKANSFTNRALDFHLVNVMTTNGFDVGFETSTIANWPYDWWGGAWGMYINSISTAKSHSGQKSMYIDMQPQGGAVFTHKVDGSPVNFTVKGGKTYEVGVWIYMEELGNKSVGDNLDPDLRFYPNDWSNEFAFFFPSTFTTGQWVYMAKDWTPSADKTVSFIFRGYNVSSSVSTRFYMDDLIIFEKEVRP